MIWNDAAMAARGEKLLTPWVGQQVKEHGGQKVVSYGLGAFGYDVRLGNEWSRLKRGAAVVLDPKRNQASEWERVTGFEIVIDPGECVLAATFEKITMPDDVVALCIGKSTYARLGLLVNATPLEPGWVGHVTLELSNTNRVPMRVYCGEGIAQLLFFEGARPAVTYAERAGKYQNQGSGPVHAVV